MQTPYPKLEFFPITPETKFNCDAIAKEFIHLLSAEDRARLVQVAEDLYVLPRQPVCELSTEEFYEMWDEAIADAKKQGMLRRSPLSGEQKGGCGQSAHGEEVQSNHCQVWPSRCLSRQAN